MPTPTAARPTRLITAITLGTLLLTLLAPATAADDGLEVTTPFPAVAIAPGSSASFDLSVTLTGVTTTVALRVDGAPDDWNATFHGGSFVVDGVTAGPDTPGEVRLDVDVPPTASAGTTTLAVIATAAGRTDRLEIAVRVAADIAGEVTLTTDSPTLTGASDASFAFDLTLSNDSAQDLTVSVAAQGDPAWDINAEITGQEQAASTVVEAGATVNLRVTADAPDDAPAGTYPLTVTATAGEQTVQAELAVEVTGSFSLTLATPNDLLSAHGSAGGATTQALEITNTGTAPLTAVAVTSTQPTDWTVTFDTPTVDQILPSETATVTATITPSGEAVSGDYVVTFSATNAEADDEIEMRFTVDTPPIWAIVALLVIAAILGGLFYVFRTYGRR